MRSLLLGMSLLALAAPAVHAQQTGRSTAAAVSGQTEPGTYLVFFDFNRSTLNADARRTVAKAAEEYRRAGSARISLAGHGDRAGTESANRVVSERRVEAVRRELTQQGVPASAITSTEAEGETNPLVSTADGVREARNRRVEIQIAGADVAAAPVPVPSSAEPAPVPIEPTPTRVAEPRERAERFTFSLGPIYGHNFKETDEDTDSDLLGAELVFNALPGFLGGVSLKQGVFWAFNAEDDGLAGRTVLSLDLAPDLGFVRPRLSANFGGVYGNGVQDGLVAGPELALDVNLPGGFTLRPKVAYDYQFRNPWGDWDDWGNGILWTGLDLGIRF